MIKFKTILAAVSLPLILTGLGFLGSTPPVQGQTTSTCAKFLTVNTTTSPSYYVQTNYWNSGACPTTQCMTIDGSTGDFAVTAGDFECGDNVANYPSIVYGCQQTGSCSNSSNLPMEVNALSCVTSSWNIAVTNATGGDLWDAAYDIWFCPTNSNLNAHSAELMIWMNYMPGTGPAGSLKASGISLGNSPSAWDVYEGPTGGSPGWNYIAFLADTPNITSFNDVDILAFINYCVSQGYIQSTWYLTAIEAGIEMRTGGVPFSSNGFSANVNGASCGTPTVTPTFTPTATFTPTPTSTPCGYPGNTCTPTDTPTATATPGNPLVAFPNPWPDPKNPGDDITFNYQNLQPADQIQFKIFTPSFRKVYEDDTLQTGSGTETVNVTQLRLANGLYYFVVVWKNGGHQSQKIMKVLIQR